MTFEARYVHNFPGTSYTNKSKTCCRTKVRSAELRFDNIRDFCVVSLDEAAVKYTHAQVHSFVDGEDNVIVKCWSQYSKLRINIILVSQTDQTRRNSQQVNIIIGSNAKVRQLLISLQFQTHTKIISDLIRKQTFWWSNGVFAVAGLFAPGYSARSC